MIDYATEIGAPMLPITERLDDKVESIDDNRSVTGPLNKEVRLYVLLQSKFNGQPYILRA